MPYCPKCHKTWQFKKDDYSLICPCGGKAEAGKRDRRTLRGYGLDDATIAKVLAG